MATTTKTAKTVFTADASWWDIVQTQGGIELEAEGWKGDWETAADEADIDIDDPESWVVRVAGVDEQHDAIKIGDYACCQGYGDDVIFVRVSKPAI